MRDVGQVIKCRRLELALSVRELAGLVGCRVGTLQALEKGADLGNWPLRLVERLRTALGLEWSDLDGMETSAGDPDVVRMLGAELVRTGRLRDIDLRAAGVQEAVPELRRVLDQVGLTLTEPQEGAFVLAARDNADALPRTFEAAGDRFSRGALTEPEEEVVAAVATGTLDVQRLSAARTRALASLLRAGLVKERDGRYSSTGPLATALGLG